MLVSWLVKVQSSLCVFDIKFVGLHVYNLFNCVHSEKYNQKVSIMLISNYERSVELHSQRFANEVGSSF